MSTIENRSIGASPGSQFGCYISEDFSLYDVVFVDSVPNDEQVAEREGATAYDDRLSFEIVSTIARQSRVVVLGFTNASNLESETATYAMRRRIAGACGAQFIDTRAIVLELGRTIIDAQAELYEHPAHPNRDIARAIGFELGRAITSLSWPNHLLDKSSDYSSNFRTYDPIQQLTEDKKTLRHNSLIKLTCAELVPGDELVFSDPGVCVGFYMENYTGASILLIGDGNPTLVRFRYKSVRSNFEIIFNQLWNWVSLEKVVIVQPAVSEGEVPKAVLSKFLFWSPGAVTCVPQAADFNSSFLQAEVHRSLKVNSEIWRAAIQAHRNAQVSARGGNKEAGYKGLREALTQFPDHLEALNDLGRLCGSTGRHAEAEAIYTKLRSLRPDDFKIIQESVQLLVRLHRYEDALGLLNSGLSLATGNAALIDEASKISTMLELHQKSSGLVASSR